MATQTTITPPPALSSARGVGLRTVVALFVCASAALLYALPGQDVWLGAVLAAAAAVAAAANHQARVVHAAVAWLLVYLAAVALGGPAWPIPALAALAVCGAVAAVRRPAWRSVRADWLRPGRFTPLIWLLLAVTVLVSAVALVVWAHLAHPDTSAIRAEFGSLPLIALLPLGVALAAVNAAAEETLFRGLLMSALNQLIPVRWLVVAVQAVAFGIAHIAGFPGGPAGMALAAFYGAVLGVIRQRSGGLLPCWAAHLCADSVIFGLMVGLH